VDGYLIDAGRASRSEVVMLIEQPDIRLLAHHKFEI
jgi:hypothetical protein